MSAWVVVPCLLALRAEFNALNPSRDKGADGTIGDSNHNSSSDHSGDEDSDVLRDHDADDKNEVHALDIDSTGPWPHSFNQIILDLVARERAEYNHPTTKARLKYVIWNRRIASRSAGWEWRAYSGSDPHTNHAHFSALYTTSTEADTRSWGVAPTEEEDVALTSAEIAAIADAVWKYKLQDPYEASTPERDRNLPAGTWVKYTPSRGQVGQVQAQLADLQTRVDSQASAIARANALLAELAARPAGVGPTVDQLVEALRLILRDGVA
jgi:hypothetical protein